MITRRRLGVGAWLVIGVGIVAYAVRARDEAPAPQPAGASQSAAASAHSGDPLAAAGADMAQAANNLLAALSADQRSKISFEFKDEERYNWHFIPRVRKGLPLKEMDHAQRPLAHALLSTGLGQRGYVEAVTIISLEQILKEMEQGRGPTRDPENYSFSIFGKPGPQGTWGWRDEGHHLSLHFTLEKLTPQQRYMLLSQIDLYARRLRTEMAEQDLRKLMDAGVEKVRFAWAGGLERGQPHYYRILGPTFLIEYDNTQNNANHIHTVWRDLSNDFGEDVLKK